MDDNTRKEEFSYGYVYSLVASCGYVFSKAERPQDLEGIDVTITSSEGVDDAEIGRVTAQIKCTSDMRYDKGSYIMYPLEIRNYVQLIKRSIDPRVLILFFVPREHSEWISFSEDFQQTIIKKCSYLINLEGFQPSSNTCTQSIKIDKEENLLTRERLIEVMTYARNRRLNISN